MNCFAPNITKNLKLHIIQFCLYFCLKVYVVICIMGLVYGVFCQWNEDAINKKIEFVEFCNSACLEILAYTDNKMKTITVSFKLLDSKYKDCFEFYDIVLERRGEKIDKDCRIWNKDKKELSFSCTLENITCGLYEIIIQPCYDKWECSLSITPYPKLMNMSSSDCISDFPQSLSRKSKTKLPKPALNIETVIGLAIASVILIIVTSGLLYHYCWLVGGRKQKESKLEITHEKIDILPTAISVYILHYYDNNNMMKSKVGDLKNALIKSSYFKSVKDIEDELAYILFDVNKWLDSLLKKKDKEGNWIKLILIDSENFQAEEYELENLIYYKFIEKLSNDISRCLKDYESLFVVKLDGVTNNSERLRDVVRRDRCLIPRDLNDLCLNLCSVSNV